jgi:hypothetical protein
MNMRKSIMMLMLLAGVASAQAAISEKYSEGYDFESLPLNTETNESNISLFADNQLLFLNDGKVYLSQFTEQQDSLLAPEENAALTKMGIKGNVAYDAATNKMYFSLVESENCEWLYESTYKNGKWTSPKRLEIEGMGKVRGNNAFMANAGWSYISTVKNIMQNPAIAKNGTRLYFTSATIENGQGGKDLWYIDQKSDKLWAAPVNAGETVNSAADEDFAFVEKDELLYFSSNKEGITHLYLAEVAGDAWHTAQKLESPYNSAVNDYSMLVTNGTPYLVSDRNTGNGSDIFAFVKRPCQISVSDIEVVQEFTGGGYAITGKVTFKDAPSTGNLYVKDDTGVAKTFELPVQSPFSFEIDNLDCDKDTVTRAVMAWFSDTNCESKATYLAPAEIKREFYWVYFLFEFDKSELLPQSKADMDRLVKEMQKFPEAKFEVSGYADERGSNEYNDKLSKRRAEAVKKALIEKGISADKLKIVAKGKRELQIKEAQDENQHAQNRRVEVRIINPENK